MKRFSGIQRLRRNAVTRRICISASSRLNVARLVILLATCGLFTSSAPAADWLQWRGPFLNGASPETNLPVRWTKTENVAWSTPLPGRSGATPIVAGGSVFVPSPDEAHNLRLFCLDSASGTVRWQRLVGTGDRTIGKNNMAACSPASDGTNVYTLFGTGDFACFDGSGQELWKRDLTEEFGTFAVLFLYGASPLLHDGKLYVPLLQRNPPTYGHARDDMPGRKSWLICIDPASGKTLWAAERPTGAREEAMEAYTTPILLGTPPDTQILVAGANALTAHSPADGSELWRFSGLNLRNIAGGRIVPSPVVAAGMVFVCGPKREMLVAVRPPDSAANTPEVSWKVTANVPDVCTPLYYQGRLFVLDGDRQMLTCFSPESGEKIWQGKLPVREIFYSSPTGADGKIYCLSEDGTAVVLSAGEKFEVLATIPMGEGPASSSIVPSGGRLFIRTAKNLYCTGK